MMILGKCLILSICLCEGSSLLKLDMETRELPLSIGRVSSQGMCSNYMTSQEILDCNPNIPGLLMDDLPSGVMGRMVCSKIYKLVR